MKQSLLIISLILIFAGCKKDEDYRTTGTDTIDNLRYMSTTFFTYGFLFSTGKLVSTEATPKPDIVVDTMRTSVRPNIYIQGSVNSGFFKYGEYPDEATAIATFDALNTFTAGNWEDWANPVIPNQIWIYRSNDRKYTKFRIVSTEQRSEQGVPVTEVTFQWTHQPDGSQIFP